MRWASPSTTAVLPTPGSPMSTGLFLVRRDSTCTTRRISASRPMTGSSLPSRAAGGEVGAVLLQRLVGALRVGGGDLARRRAAAGTRAVDGAGVAGRSRRCAASAEQQVLGGDVVVAHRLPSRAGRARSTASACAGGCGGRTERAAAPSGSARERRLGRARRRRRRRPGGPSTARWSSSACWARASSRCAGSMCGMSGGGGRAGGGREGLLGLGGQLQVHGATSFADAA